MTIQDRDELLKKRLDELCKYFEKWVNIANNGGIADRPARHFHIKTITRLKNVGLDGEERK